MRVLIVDDNPSIGRVALRVLSRAGHDAVSVGSVAEAREALLGEPFDFVVSDVMMPRETGLDLYLWVAERLPTLAGRVMLMSSGVSSPQILRSLREQAITVHDKVEVVGRLDEVLRERVTRPQPPGSPPPG